MKENLRVRVGAVVLALATLAAVIFAWLNFLQRSRYDMVDDGVAWTDSPLGIEAWKVAANSPAAMAATKRALWQALEVGLSEACRAVFEQ